MHKTAAKRLHTIGKNDTVELHSTHQPTQHTTHHRVATKPTVSFAFKTLLEDL